MDLARIINGDLHPILDYNYIIRCKLQLLRNGVLVLENFLRSETLEDLKKEAQEIRPNAYFCYQKHNAFLLEEDSSLPKTHIRNLELVSDKGCIPHDKIPKSSRIRSIYESNEFRNFLERVLGENLYPYSDKLSSININYYEKGQQLGWHFDNASFAVTLMIQSADKGGEFQYLEKLRNLEEGDLGYKSTEELIKGKIKPKNLSLGDGTLVLFRGRNSLHRVVPVYGKKSRILVTLNFNTKPGVMLSETARMVFFGRLN